MNAGEAVLQLQDLDRQIICPRPTVFGQIIEVIESLRDAGPRGWIPCLERTPNNRRRVIIFSPENGIGASEAVFINGRWYHPGSALGTLACKITHWREVESILPPE